MKIMVLFFYLFPALAMTNESGDSRVHKAPTTTSKIKVSEEELDFEDFEQEEKSEPLFAAQNENALADDFPKNAQPGQCFAKVIIPAKFKYETEKVLISPEVTKYKTTRPKYGLESKKILIKEASERLVTVPATYKYVSEKVLVKEASEKLVRIPATYKTVTRKIKISDEVVEWKKGQNHKDLNGSSNDPICLVKKPAQYRTVAERVLVTPEKFDTVQIPAQYKNVKRRVLNKPASVKRVTVPAQYRTVKVKKVIKEAGKVPFVVPARYQTVSKRIQLTDSKTEWRQVLCKTNAQVVTISKLQKALKNAGFNPGRIDGILGKNTARAVKKFQKAKSLPEGALTIETIKALKVKL